MRRCNSVCKTRCTSFAPNLPPHPLPISLMSSSSSRRNVPSLQFQDVFDAALKEYRHKTGKDIATNPLAARFLDCKSPAAVLDILEEQARAFDQFRKGDRELMKRLKPIVDILHGLTTNDIIVGGISLVRPPRSNCPLWEFIIHPADISTSECHICWCWSPTRSTYTSPSLPVSVASKP